jgi:hypothetical protein
MPTEQACSLCDKPGADGLPCPGCVDREEAWDAYVDWLQNRPKIPEGDYLTEEELGMQPDDAYIQVKLLTWLLSGEKSCRWASWFQAHHRDFDRAPDDDQSNLAKWKMQHTELMEKARNRMERRRYAVATEWQNQFRLRGKTGIILAGKPDLIAVKGDMGVILDAKTGRPWEADVVQVMIYMWAVPQCFDEYQGVTFRGRLLYKNGKEVTIPAEQVDEAFERKLVRLIEKVGGSKPLRKVPSADECRFCPISRKECPERVLVAKKGPPANTDKF